MIQSRFDNSETQSIALTEDMKLNIIVLTQNSQITLQHIVVVKLCFDYRGDCSS